MKRIIVIFLVFVSILNAGENRYALIKLGQIDSCGSTVALAVDDRDRIFVARFSEGLSVYSFDTTSGFIELANINNGGTALDVDVSSDGQTIFLANKSDGLRIYSYSDTGFAYIDHYIPEEIPSFIYRKNDINSVEIIENNTILFTRKVINESNDANMPQSHSYGEAYTCIWDGESFSNLSLVFGYPYLDAIRYISGLVSDVAFINSNTIVGGCGDAGIGINHSSLSPTGTGGYVYDVDIFQDGTILTANSTAGLKAYRFSEQFELAARVDEGGAAFNIHENSDGILFLANGTDGIRVYSYDTTFHSLAHADDGGIVKDITELSDGTIIAANKWGLIAYSFLDTSSNDENDPPDDPGIPHIIKLFQNYPNPFNPITTIDYDISENSDVRLDIYNIFGKRIETLVDKSLPAGAYKVEWDASKYSSGIYIYRLQVGDQSISRKMLLIK